MARPTLIARAKLPNRRDNDPERWVTIGAAWPANFNNGEGLSVKLQTIPVGWTGDLVLMPPQNDET